MVNFNDFILAAKILQEEDLTISPLYEAKEPLSPEQIRQLCQLEAGLQTDRPELIEACCAAGFRDLYFDCARAKDEVLSALHGKCRYLLEGKDNVKQLDRVVAPCLQLGYLETVAIKLQTSGDETHFTPENIPAFSRWIRFSQNLAVRGIFVDMKDAADPSEAAKQSFSLIKKVRSDMPCLFSYFCFEGLLEPLKRGDPTLRNTLRMLASLNDTSLYAKFYIK